MSLPPGFLDELRTRLSLVDVVGRKVMWDARKSNQGKGDMWAPCPFHHEKSASFHVDDRKGFYYCFGCHAKGDAISFVRETENVGFMEAVEILAGEAGLPMPAANQLELHPLTQKPELLAFMKAHQILPIAYSSLAPLSNWREGYQAIKGTKTDEEKKVTTVEVIAKRLGVSPARVLLRYALQRGWACIPKTTKEERLKENLDLEAFELSEADVKALDALEANANVTWDAPPGQHFDLTTLP